MRSNLVEMCRTRGSAKRESQTLEPRWRAWMCLRRAGDTRLSKCTVR